MKTQYEVQKAIKWLKARKLAYQPISIIEAAGINLTDSTLGRKMRDKAPILKSGKPSLKGQLIRTYGKTKHGSRVAMYYYNQKYRGDK